MGPEDPSNRKKIPIIFVDAKFLEIARGFEKKILKSGAEGLNSYPKFSKKPIIKSVARKGQNTPKSDFRGPKIPPRGASST